MLKDEFYHQLWLIIGVGLVYIWSMKKMAGYKPAETQGKHTVMKSIGSLFALLALCEAILGVYQISNLWHPIGDSYYLRHATSEQRMAITQITHAMSSLGVAAYFILYKKSNTKWWQKVLKFIFGLFLYFLHGIFSTRLHDSNLWEMMIIIELIIMPIAFILLWFDFRISLISRKKPDELESLAANTQSNEDWIDTKTNETITDVPI